MKLVHLPNMLAIGIFDEIAGLVDASRLGQLKQGKSTGPLMVR